VSVSECVCECVCVCVCGVKARATERHKEEILYFAIVLDVAGRVSERAGQ
jgi:hypothetical protein